MFNVFPVVAVAALLFLNVNVVLNGKATSYLKLEAIGSVQAESTSGSGSGGFWAALDSGLSNLFQGQGWTKDEREWTRPCPLSSGSSTSVCVQKDANGVCIKYEISQTNPTNRNEITCPVGSVNCSTVGC